MGTSTDEQEPRLLCVHNLEAYGKSYIMREEGELIHIHCRVWHMGSVKKAIGMKVIRLEINSYPERLFSTLNQPYCTHMNGWLCICCGLVLSQAKITQLSTGRPHTHTRYKKSGDITSIG